MKLISALKFACFVVCKIYTDLFEQFLLNIVQEFWIYEQELPNATYDITFIATKVEI